VLKIAGFQLPNFKLPNYSILNRRKIAILIVESRALRSKGLDMIPEISKDKIRRRIHERLRRRMQGSSQRPRLNVYRSLNHIYAQVIDDASGKTLAAASTVVGKEGGRKTGGNVASAKEVGKVIAQRAQEKGIKKVVFDRGGYLYHGRIKALAEAAREAGLEF
jgi:large subunit ribosomal protein L18